MRRAAALSLFAVPLVTLAHHSLAEFDRSRHVEIEGEVVRVMWSNPHVRITLRVQNVAGAEEIWDLTGLDLNSLNRRNVPSNLVAEGDVVRISGNPSNRRERSLYVSNLLIADGTEIMVSPDAEPLWSRNVVGRPAAGELAIPSAPAQASIFRVWSRDPAAQDLRRFPFTPAAIAARASWNPDDNFATRCEPEGMPRIMTNPHPFEFVDRGTVIALKSELYDLTRTIHMDGADMPADQSASPLGYSVGHWEDTTLVVTTTLVNWPYFDNFGTPQSPAARFEERFALGKDSGRLDYRLTITDPTTFTAPAVYERYWLARGEALQPYNCRTY